MKSLWMRQKKSAILQCDTRKSPCGNQAAQLDSQISRRVPCNSPLLIGRTVRSMSICFSRSSWLQFLLPRLKRGAGAPEAAWLVLLLPCLTVSSTTTGVVVLHCSRPFQGLRSFSVRCHLQVWLCGTIQQVETWEVRFNDGKQGLHSHLNHAHGTRMATV